MLAAGLFFSSVTFAQDVLAVLPAPFKGQVGLNAKDSKSDFPKPVQAQGAPQHRGRAPG